MVKSLWLDATALATILAPKGQTELLRKFLKG
jgi:hypothetical protein